MQRIVFFCFLLPAAVNGTLFGNQYVLKDGRTLDGQHALLSRVDESANTPDNVSRQIAAIDDGLRITYMSKSRITKINQEQEAALERFKTDLNQNFEGARYQVIGSFQNAPFDKYGRRLLEMHHSGGIEYVEQGITNLNPYYIKVTGLRGNNKPRVWDMRIASGSIPREQITPILLNLIDPSNAEDRIKLVRFYYGGNRYGEAQAEILSILDEWKNDEDVQARVKPMMFSVRMQKYQTVLDELEHRWDGGQYLFVKKYLHLLENDEEIPDRLLETVKRMLRRYDDVEKQHQTIVTQLRQFYAALKASDKSPELEKIIDAIDEGLNGYTLKRLTTYQLYAEDKQLSAAEKLAFAVTGWYAGDKADNSRLGVAVMLKETSELVAQYITSGKNKLLQSEILKKLKSSEAARPDLIAGILAVLPPKIEYEHTSLEEPSPPVPAESKVWEFRIPNPLYDNFGGRMNMPTEFRYLVQVPPEYNPNLRYPVIVSLNGLQQTPEMQLDYWCGSWKAAQEPRFTDIAELNENTKPEVPKERRGQAARNGYIVIAPDWNPVNNRKVYYDFSAVPHTAVLTCMKDAFRRFAVDTDKVFITGHGIGGNAAWDIALGHPDLWAGCIAFNAQASKYIEAYRENSYCVPLYLVFGELDGHGNLRNWDINVPILNRYLQKQSAIPDVTVVRYTGRGEEGFPEEQLHLFNWMKQRKRNFAPEDFEVASLRAWDSFFWWVEMYNLKQEQPENIFEPFELPAKPTEAWNKRIRIDSKVQKSGNTVLVNIKPKISSVQIYLTPDMLDFKTRAEIKVNGKRFSPSNGRIEPGIEVMLEDVRSRCDRIHPFWAVVTGN